MGLRQAERSGLELSQGESLCHQYGDHLGGAAVGWCRSKGEGFNFDTLWFYI